MPILLAGNGGVVGIEDVLAARCDQTRSLARSRIERLLPRVSLNLAAEANYATLAGLLRQAAEQSRVLLSDRELIGLYRLQRDDPTTETSTPGA